MVFFSCINYEILAIIFLKKSKLFIHLLSKLQSARVKILINLQIMSSWNDKEIGLVLKFEYCENKYNVNFIPL